MTPTGYDVQMYRDIGRIARALEQVADRLEPRPAPPIVLTIRDPDWETEHVVEGDVRIIDIDLGSQFNGPKDFNAASDEGREWIADTLDQVTDLPADSPVRRRVEDLVDNLIKGD